MATIVYIDDESYLTDLFKVFFANTEHKIDVFNDELAAIDFCTKNPPDILFVDYQLEDLSGDEVASRIPDTAHKVLVTGCINVETDFNFDRVLIKPFKLNILLDMVKELIEH